MKRFYSVRRLHVRATLVVLLSFIQLFLFEVKAQTDTTFWFAVPEVANDHADRPIFLRFTSQGLAAQVTISQPANLSFLPIQVNVPANGVSSIDLTDYIDQLENVTPNVVAKKGLLIQSNAAITAYYEINASNNPDIFSLKGNTALGMSFMIPGQDFMSNGNGKNAFDIVATEDNTTITITPTKALEGGRAANVAFTITLNKGETFSCRAAATGTGDKLTGSTVTANKPIAITLIDDSVRGGDIYTGSCRDLLGDQLIPISALGQEFIVQRGFLNVHNNNNNDRTERVIIMAVENGTAIYLDGSATAIATLNAGATYHRRMGSNLAVTHIVTNKPVYVIHISGFGCETGMAVIPAISCTGSSLVGFRRSTAEQFGITVTTRTVHIDSFTLNNVPITLSFTAVPGTNSEWSYARIFSNLNDTSSFNLSTGYILENSSGNFHLGIINGGSSTGCRYGYFSGFAQVNVKATSNSTVEAPACQASPVFIEADSIFKATYSWTGPNGFTTSARVINFPQVTFADTGLYTVTATVDNCISRIDSINIVIKPRPNEALATNDGPDYCHGSTIQLFAGTVPGVTYHWIGPNGFSSNSQNPVITPADFVNGGTYRLITELDGCSSDTTFTEIYVYPRPVITPLSAVEFCRYDSVTLVTGGGVSYQWYKNDTLISGVNDSFYVVWAAGDYYAVVTNEFDCRDTADAITVTVFPLPDKQLGIDGDTAFCTGGSVRLFTSAGYQYSWFHNGLVIPGETDSFLVTQIAGEYKVVVMSADSCVDSSQSVEITVYEYPVAGLTSNADSICAGETAILSADGGVNYAWLHEDTLVLGADSAVLMVTLAGSYQVIVYNPAGCSDTSSAITIKVQSVPSSEIDSSGPLEFCAGDSVALASVHAATSYNWLKDGISVSNDSCLTVTVGGSYQLILTNEYGCIDSSATVSVIVNPLPVAAIDSSGSLTFCAGDSVVLASTGSATGYEWLKDGIAISSDSSISVAAAGAYQLVLTNEFGCVDSSEVVSVIVNPLPVAAIDSNGSLTFCAGDSVVLASTSSATGYSWLKDGVAISSDSSISVATAGTYQLVITNEFGCTDSSEIVSVIVNPLPVAAIDSNGSLTFCAGDSVVLASTGSATGYSWLKDGVAISSDSSISVAAVGTYQLILTNEFGCIDSSATVSVIVNPLPVAAIDSNGTLTFCAGDSVVLASTSSATGYEWLKDGVVISSDSSISVAAAGTYQLVITNEFGCIDSSATVSVIVNPLPVAAIDSNGALTFCAGDSVVLASAGSATGYSWLKDGAVYSSDSSISVATAGAYQLILTNEFGCVDSSEVVSVIVNPLPIAAIDSNGSLTFCDGDSVVLASTGSATGYSWLKDGVAIASDSSISVAAAGTYQLILTNQFGCTDSSEIVSVIVNPLPVAAIDSNGALTFCAGDSVVLASTGSATGYSWLKDGAVYSSDSSISVATAGAYQLILTNEFGCVDSSEVVTVIVNPLPVAAIDSNGALTFCAGDSVVLASTGSATGYSWLKDGVAISSDSSISVAAAGAYQLVLTNEFGCVDSSEVVSVIVNPLPVAAIDSNGSLTFCAGDSVVLASTGSATGYSWLKDGAVYSSDSSISVATAGAYQLILTNEFGCVDSSEVVTVIVNPLPVAAIDSNGALTFCAGDSVVLASTGSATGYSWLKDGVAISSDSSISVTTAGTYQLILTNQFGCTDSSNVVSVIVNPLPVAAIDSNGSLTFCAGDSVVLASTSSATGYSWLKDGAAYSSDSSISVATAGTYQLVITNEFGCTDSSEIVSVIVNPLHVAAIDSNGTLTFCAGDSVVLASTGSATGYSWLKDGVAISSDSSISVAAAGAYQLVLTNEFGCVDSSEVVSVIVNPLPVAAIDSNGALTFCAGDSVVLASTGSATGYSWLKDGVAISSDSSISVAAAGTYQLILTNQFGCTDSSEIVSVIVNPLPVAAIDSNGSLTFCAGDSVVLASTGSATGYNWLKDGVAISSDSSISVAAAGAYQLVLTNEFGCVDSSEVVSVIVNPLPVAAIDSNGSLTFCAGDSVVLASTSSATGYEWLKDGVAISSDSSISVATAGTYQLVITNEFGCVDSSEVVTVIVNPLPVAAIDSNGALTFCAGDSVVLASTGSATGYSWLKDGVAISSDSSISVAAAGAYQLVLTNEFGCVDSSEVVSVIVNPLPVAAIDSNGSLTFCAGDSVVLASTGSATGYSWLKDGAVYSSDSSISVATAGTYQLVITNEFGCTDSSEIVSVIVNPLPVAAIDSNGSLTFCAGDSVVLASTGSATGYSWLKDGVAISSDSSISVAAAGTYQLILTNEFGCVDSSEVVSVIVNPLPVAAIDSNGSLTFCTGDSVVLASTGSATGYSWLKDGVAISSDSSISVAAAGTYQLILTNQFGCTDSSEIVSVIVNPLPIAAIDSNGSLTFCAGDSVVLASAGSATGYSWLKDGAVYSSDSSISVATAGAYQLILTNEFGCVDSSEVVTVIVNPLPVAAIDSNGALTFCAGDSVVLASTGSATGYSWLKDGVAISSDSSISVAAAGTYQLILTNQFGCTDSSEIVSVIVNPLPVAAIDSNGSLTFCAGDSVVLASTGSATGYSWLKDGAVYSSDSSISVATAGAYQLVITNEFGCIDSSATVNVIVNPLPVAAIDSNGSLTFCAGDSVVLASTGSATGYSWLKDGAVYSSDSSISVAAAGTYQLILTNEFGCVDSSEVVTVIVNPLPVAAIDSSGSLSFCAGDSVVLASTGSATGYEWLKDGVAISSDSSISVAAAGAYQLVLTNEFGCVDSSEVVSVIVNPLPVAAIDSNGSLTFCTGDSVVLASTGSATGYSWLKDGVAISSDSSISVAAAGTYQLVITNEFGCTDSSEIVSVIVNPLPVAAIDSNGSLTFCTGDSVVLASTGSATGYSWLKDGAAYSSDSSISVATAGAYQLILTNEFGCVDSSEVVSVIVNPLPIAAIDSNGSLTFCAGDSVVLASTGSATGYSWLKDGVAISSDSSISVATAGTYQLVITNEFGCIDSSATVNVIVNPLPVAAIDSNGALTFCAGDSVVLASAGSATGYSWLKDGAVYSSDSSISVATAGAYQLILTNEFGCVDSSEVVTVIVNPLPVAAIDSSGSLTFCAGDSVVLASAGSATGYEWLKDGVVISSDTSISVTTAGTYQLILTNQFGCTDSSEIVSVIVNPLPVAAIDSSGSLSFCAGDSVVLASTGSATGYEWLKDGVAISSDSSISVATAGTYQLVITNEFGCVDSSEVVTVIDNPLPVAAIDSSGSLTFCAGDSVVLASTGSATGYNWLKDGVAISSDSSISVTTAGTYQLILTNAFGCTDSSNVVSVIVNPFPVAAIDSNGSLTFCAGDSVVLASTGSATGYSWLKDGVVISSDSSISVATAGTYQLVITNEFGCTDSSEIVSVIVNPLPVAAIDSNGSLTFCTGDSVVLASAGSATGYSWLKDGAVYSSDSSISVATAGAYQLILTNEFGCVDSSEVVSVIVNPLPIAAIDSNGSLTFCAGDSVVLASAGSATGYSWLKDGAVYSSDSSISVATAGAYQLILTNEFGCVDSSEVVTVIVNPLPVAAIDSSGSLTFCAGDSVVLASAGSATGYEWLKDGVVISSDSSISVAAAGTYQLILTNDFGCVDSSEAVTVIVNPLPVAAIDSNGSLTFCAGDSVVLASTSSATGYEWLKDGLAISSDSSISVATAGTYQLILTNQFGCTDSSEIVSVIVNPLPVAAIDSNGSLTFCTGDSVLLASTGSATGYSWLKDGVAISSDSSISVTTAGTYQLILTNAFGCTDSSEIVSVIVNPLPVATIDSNGSLTFCAGDSVVLASTSSATGYSWLKDGAVYSSDSSISVATAGAYQLVITNEFGCIDSSATVNVIVNPLPVAAIDSNGSLTFCAGDSVVLASTGSATGYSWLKDGAVYSSDSSISVATAGAYQLILTNEFGCVDSSEVVSVIVNPLPVAAIDSNGSLTFCAGDSVVLASTSSATGYSWLKDGLTFSTNPSITATLAGSYQLILTNAFGCQDTSTAVNVTVLPIPQPIILSSGSLTFCQNDSVVLSTSGGTSYQWFENGLPISGANDSFLVVYGTSNWSVQITNAFGCTNSSPVSSTNRLSPPLNFNIRANNMIKCAQDTVIIETNFSPLATYQWLHNGITIPGANQYQYLAAEAGEYACEVMYGSNCQITPPAILIREFELPNNFELQAPSTICKGETMEIMAPLIPEAQYNWRGPNGFVSFVHRPVLTDVGLQNAGWYYLTMSIPACGDFLDSIFIQVQPGIGEIEITGKKVICGNGNLKLNATSIPGAQYEWVFASGKRFEGNRLDLSQLEEEDGGFVELTVTRGSCTSFERFFVEFFAENIYFPNAFTPNYDGLNDEFLPQTQYIGPYELQIYDRWGKLVFTANHPSQGWNGLVNGEEANGGNYTWICFSENCSKQRIVNRGSIQLIK